MKTKKLLSLLLALMMMLSVVPMYASAATQIALKATHVTEWPTAEGEIYYGEPLSKINLVGGKVVYEGVEVPGHFEHVDPAATAEEAMEGYEADIKFVPDDTATYKGFTKYYSKTTFTVHKATPVLADESKPPVVNGTVDAGVTLSTITISDGAMVNPYDADETYAKKATWKWSNPNTVVSESGYYEAKFVAGSIRYVTVTRNLWVEVYKEIPLSVISELPIIETFNYNPSITWADVEIKGGKAVIENDDGTTTEINGVFSFSNEHLLNTVPSVGTFELDIVFTPENSEEALPCNFRIPVTVNKGQIKFVDENGAEIVPEITVDFGADIDDIETKLKGFALNTTENCWFQFGGLEGNDKVETGTYDIVARSYAANSNYLETTLQVKVVVNPKTLTPKAYSSTEGYYVQDNSGVYHVEGTFDVYVDGELYKSGVAYLEKVAYVPETSGTHEIKFVYNPVENDNFAIENEITSTVTVNLVHKLTLSDNILGKAGDYRYGTAIEISANLIAENFAGWKITDAQGNEVTLDGVDNSKTKITITMPDYDIHVEALEKGATNGDNSTGGIFDGLGDLTQGDSDNPIVNIFNNIIAWFKNIINTIIELFRSIGNNS